MDVRSQGILVLEDDPDIAELSVMLLSTAGFQAHSESTVPGALEFIKVARPACVLLDFHIQGRDGLDFAREVRRDYGDSIKLIAVSGWKPTDPRVAELRTLVDHYFLKPIEWDSCFAVLRA